MCDQKNKKIYLILFSLFLFNFFLANISEAKRRGPKKVKPAFYKGVKYTAPHFLAEEKQNGGFIIAWDMKTKKKLWKLKVYKIYYNHSLEQDVQDVFIVKLKIDKKKNRLIVINKNNGKYEVNLKTKEVKQVK